MALEHTPLDVSKQSAAVQKALAPGPARIMAAKGLMPLPTPGELLTVLYQLGIDSDPNVAAAARATAEKLPIKVLQGAVADPTRDPRVLDWVAPKVADRPELHDALVGNVATADTTIAMLAGRGGPREVDLIATNEQRLLRHPAIIAAMYTNSKARMSTVDRAVELAVRNEIRVPGLDAWDEISRALSGAPPATAQAAAEADLIFEQASGTLNAMDDTALTAGDAETYAAPEGDAAAEAPPPVDEKKVPINKLSIPAKIRLATLGNAFARGLLVRDPIKMVAVAAIKSPGVTEMEAARYAANNALSDEVIRNIAMRREWTRIYGIKRSLILNPKTPMSESMRMMPFLREKDLAFVIKSKGVPSAVVAQARKILTQRKTSGNK